MSSWLDRLTLSQRKLVFLVIALALVGLGAYSLRLSPSPPSARDEVSPSTHLSPEDVTNGFVMDEGRQANDTALVLSDHDVTSARAVAERFAVEYATRRWDEPPSARLARMSELMSPDLVAAFSTDSGSAALEEERRSIQEVVEARPELAYPQTISRDEVVFTIVVHQTVSSTKGTEERRPSYQVAVAPFDGGWRVVNVVA